MKHRDPSHSNEFHLKTVLVCLHILILHFARLFYILLLKFFGGGFCLKNSLSKLGHITKTQSKVILFAGVATLAEQRVGGSLMSVF